MVIFSLVCAVGVFILSIIFSLVYESMLILLAGFVSAAFFVLIANMLSNQQSIMEVLERQELQTEIEKRKTVMKVSCSQCKNEFEVTRSSCPHCGVKAS